MDVEDLANFPSKDLCTINQLWLAASEGKFGFSVQKQILTNLSDEPREYYIDVFEIFLKKVGWAENKIVFDQRAKARKGHLPVGVYVKASNNLMINQKWWVEIDKIVKTSEEERDKKEKKLKEELEKTRKKQSSIKARINELVQFKERQRQKRRRKLIIHGDFMIKNIGLNLKK